jgi:hypothetical protein
LTQLVTDPRFELTAVWVSSEAKVGKDAGELAGLDVATGITATNDLDALLATQPECAVYCAMGDNRTAEAIGDCQRLLAAGVNVVGSAPGVLQFPWQLMPDKYIERVEDAARQGNSSLFITGVDPGFANDLIPLALAGTCQRVEQVRCMEIADYATYDGAIVMFDVMGFGKPLDELPILLQPGVLGIAWGTAIRHLAAGLGVEVDDITEATNASRRRRPSTSRPVTSRRAASPRCGSRFAAWSRAGPPSSSNTSPGCATTCAPTGRGPRSRAAHIASKSPVSRPTRSTFARPAARATTTTLRSWQRRAASSTPFPRYWRPSQESGRRWTCR